LIEFKLKKQARLALQHHHPPPLLATGDGKDDDDAKAARRSRDRRRRALVDLDLDPFHLDLLGGPLRLQALHGLPGQGGPRRPRRRRAPGLPRSSHGGDALFLTCRREEGASRSLHRRVRARRRRRIGRDADRVRTGDAAHDVSDPRRPPQHGQR